MLNASIPFPIFNAVKRGMNLLDEHLNNKVGLLKLGSN